MFWSNLTKNITPYESGEQTYDREYIKLNTNENPFPPSEFITNKLKEAVDGSLRLYPDPDSNKLKKVISNYYHVNIDNVFIGNGSDEVLAFSFMAFFKGKKYISFPDITYSFYSVYCDIFEIEFMTFPLNDRFEIKSDNISTDSKGIIFPNPNAPTGIYLEVSIIESILVRFSSIVVIIDEAYIDFGGHSCVSLTEKYSNLLVVQTFSKSRSLAGLRVGFAIGNSNLINALERVKNCFNSYPLDRLASEGAIAAIQDSNYFTYCCNYIIESRDMLADELLLLSFDVLPSKANFLFVSHPVLDAYSLYNSLKENSILVRYFGKPRINNYLRISIGKKEDMITLIKYIESILRKNS